LTSKTKAPAIKSKLKKRKPRKQVGAIAYRRTGSSIKILIITSRGTGRWILPKGWPMDNKADSEAALIEAWEEAGVKRIKEDPVHCGSLQYDKVMKDGSNQPVIMQLFSFEATKLSRISRNAGNANCVGWVSIQPSEN
jgi:8-oxo-dGTP pyrophosphatase MutT (NUDIX family)